MGRATRILRSAAAALVICAAAPATAQEESIFDPENPGTEAPPRGEGEETIFDPENPDPEATPGEASPVQAAPVEAAPVPSASWAQAIWRATASVDTAFTLPTEDVYEVHNELILRARLATSSDTRLILSGRLGHGLFWQHRAQGNDLLPGPLDDARPPRALVVVDLDDAYLSTRLGDHLLVAVGQQRVPWGSTDLTRPLDLVNPLDLSRALGSPDALGLSPTYAVPALKADWVEDFGAASVVVIPFFHPHRTSVLATDFGLAKGNADLDDRLPLLPLLRRLVPTSQIDTVERAFAGTELPDQTPENASAGLRLSTRALGPDLAVSYLYGWDRVPSLKLDPDLKTILATAAADGQVFEDYDLAGFFGRHPELFTLQQNVAARAREGQVPFSATYDRWHVVGVDGAGYIGPVGVRADLAFSPRRTFITESFGATRRPATNAALGLSYEGDQGEIAVILEGFWLHAFNAAEEGEGAPLIFGRDFYGLAAGLRLDLGPLTEDDVPLGLQLGGLVHAPTFDALINLGGTWRFDGDTRLGVAAQVFTAPLRAAPLTTLGALYDPNDRVLVTFEQGF